MEGYFNVSGSHNSFDDFDIEGKKSFDIVEKKQNNFKAKFQPIGLTPVTQEEADKNRLLDMTVDLDNGAVGYVFSLTGTGYNAQWKCHVCDMIFMGIKNLLFHERSMNHSALMQASKHHASQFIRMEMKDDEPGPPGVDENEEDSEPPVLTNIQSTLDDYKTTPLIGLEYVVELNDDYEKESAYVCMLCDKKGDPRTVMAHLISYNHRLKYLERHFPITFNAINSLPKTVGARRGLAEIVLRISSEMEETFGRLRPVATDGRHFEENRFSLMCTINKSKHFIETPDKTFVHLVDRELLTAASLKTEEIPVPEGPPPINPSTKPEEAKGAMETKDEDDDEIEFQGAFVKGTRVPVTRQLRVRKLSVEAEDKNNEIATKSNEKPATSPNKKEDEVKSQCSLSSISSASSSPRSPRYRRRSSLSRSRSRSGSRNRRRRRSRSRGRYRRTRSRSRSRSRRSRSPYGNRRRQRSPRGSRVSESKRDEERKRPKERVDDISAEKAKWEKFREEVAIVEKQMLEKLSHHEKNPEKHPQYPDEWKLFWNRRYKELQQSGRDPNKHDFKPEWIEFWNRRMRELHEAEFMKRKEELREKLGLPLDEPKPHYNRRKKFLREGDLDGPAGPGGQAPRGRSRSPSPWEEGAIGGGFGARDRDFPPYRQGRGEWRNDRERSPPRTITVLRMLTALEQQLGSLGPRVNSTLSEAIGMEKLQNGNSDALLRDQQVVVLFETVKEKFKGLLLAGIVERNMVMATRNAIGAVTELLYRAPALLERVPRAPSPVKPKVEAVAVPVILPAVPVPTVAPKLPAPPATPVPAPDPVTVPGIGAVDKAAIAREIAAALIMQGKTNVSEDELEQLVSAVVGMAQAQAGSQQTVTTAQFLSAMQPVGQATPPSVPTPTPTPTPVLTPAPTLAPAPVPAAIPVSSPEVSSPLEPAALVPAQQTPEVSGLQLLQSAYDADDLKGGSLASKDKVFLPAMRTSAAESMESSSSSLPFKPTLTVGGSSQANNPIRSTAHSAQALDAYVDELTETDLRLLLQSFKDLPLDEQHGLIRYLKKLEATDPVKVEKLRKYVNLGSSNAKAPPKTVVPTEKLQALAKVGQSGRLSPFSSRMQSRNPSQCEPKRPEMLKLDSDSDDDYSFDDVCKAAKKKVSEQEAVEAERKREEEIKKKRELEEMNRRLREEKAKAEQALREIEDREREQQRIMREKERQEREQAMKVGAANWTPVSSNNSTLGSLVTSVPPPSIPPPPIPPTVPPPTMANMYNSGYGDVTGALGNFNGGPTYYGSNTFSQFPQRDGSYDQQGGYYQGQQANAGMYQQQPTYNAQGFSAYPNNSMYQQAPPTHTTSQHQGYSVGPYGNDQFRY